MITVENVYIEHERTFNNLPQSLRMGFICELIQKGELDSNIDLSVCQLFRVRNNLGKHSFVGMHSLIVLKSLGAEKVGRDLDEVPLLKDFCEIFGESSVRYLKPEMRSAHKKLKIEGEMCL